MKRWLQSQKVVESKSECHVFFGSLILRLAPSLFFMGGTGTCSVCGAEEIDINEDEMCSDCAKNEGVDFKGEDENKLDMGLDEDEM